MWVIICFSQYMFWSINTYDEEKERNKIGLWCLPFFFIPFFPFIYYLLIVPLREVDFGVLSYFSKLKQNYKTAKHKKYVDSLLEDNDEIEIVDVVISDKVYIDIEMNVTETKIADISYRYINKEVDDVIGLQKATVDGLFAEKISAHLGKKIHLKYTELKIMILNNRLDRLYK